MRLIVSLSEVKSRGTSSVGGKCHTLAEMEHRGIPVPDTLCISDRAYERYIASTGLRERILLELTRKSFADMRWEELWDSSLRIRNMFLKTPMPEDLSATLSDPLRERFGSNAVAVRSSAPGEDSAQASFAGLHESFINVRGIESILEHVRLVWASLWSDAALLYRRDLGLDVATSTMAVVVQELVEGNRSGVIFSRSPNDESQAVIESVYGLNQGLVDGTVEPDRWMIDRASGEIVSHTAPSRAQMLVPAADGVRLAPLPEHLSLRPPLSAKEVNAVYQRARQLEELFGGPQDVEWTWGDDGLTVLQSRPITTLGDREPGDERRWYLSLRRSFDNLQMLRDRIEKELIPRMIEQANALEGQPPARLSDAELAAEIRSRQEIHNRWVDVYWEEFIPFAHGIRLFGQVYNDALHPDDPYAFMDLLTGTEMASLERNRALEEMAAMIREDAHLEQGLRESLKGDPHAKITNGFREQLDLFIGRFGDLSCAMTGSGECERVPDALIRLLLEMAHHPPTRDRARQRDLDAMRSQYLDQFAGPARERAAQMLDLARTSYQLRDDDNIYLGRIEAQLLVAVEEGRSRLGGRSVTGLGELDASQVAAALEDPHFKPEIRPKERGDDDMFVRARQLVGQPAGPGVAKGRARVILSQSDLITFQHGEVLVCDAVDPNMTFVVPLAVGVVERRGGMLIHGAIIAREYGLPCVTGVPDAVSLISTGDSIVVDGYLGIITIAGRSDSVGHTEL